MTPQERAERGRRLVGKAAIVTGAGRGIGRGIALAFAEEGARVVVASRSAGPIEAVVSEIRAAGGEAIGVTCNVADKAAIEATVRRAVGAFGGLDILVNNAQSFGTAEEPAGHPVITPLEDFREGEWEYTFLSGATASLRFMQAAFPYLKASGEGRVINFGSHWGQMGYEGAAAYNATKEAIRGLTRTAAREWGKYGVTCNVIVPAIETEALLEYKAHHPERMNAMVETIPMRRYGDPLADAGRIAAFIASADARHLTGMTFNVNGGYFMYP
jgi:NAD(P)-dependent dehydrogenase (short-subunit alcohol dehydrogenase family)